MFQMVRERCFRWEGRDVSDGKGEVFQMVRERCFRWEGRDVSDGKDILSGWKDGGGGGHCVI